MEAHKKRRSAPAPSRTGPCEPARIAISALFILQPWRTASNAEPSSAVLDLACFIAAVAIVASPPSLAAEQRAWQADEVSKLADHLYELVRGIRGKIEIADSAADAMFSRRTAAARSTLGEIEKATQQLVTSLKTGAGRASTQTQYERIRTLRVKLNDQATEVGFSDPAIDLIVKARDVLVELDAYYGID